MTCPITGMLKLIASGQTSAEMEDQDGNNLTIKEIYDLGWSDGQIELSRLLLTTMEEQKDGTANG